MLQQKISSVRSSQGVHRRRTTTIAALAPRNDVVVPLEVVLTQQRREYIVLPNSKLNDPKTIQSALQQAKALLGPSGAVLARPRRSAALQTLDTFSVSVEEFVQGGGELLAVDDSIAKQLTDQLVAVELFDDVLQRFLVDEIIKLIEEDTRDRYPYGQLNTWLKL